MEYTLQKWEEKHAHDLALAANNENVSRNLRDYFPFPYAYEDAVAFIKSCEAAGEERECQRAIVVGGRAVGGIGINLKGDVNRKCAELGYWLAEEYWGKGIMTECAKEIVKIAFKKYDIVRLYAEVFETNIASQKVLLKAGFTLEAVMKKSVFKKGQIMDAHLYACVI